jgi:hypothetical protein
MEEKPMKNKDAMFHQLTDVLIHQIERVSAAESVDRKWVILY